MPVPASKRATVPSMAPHAILRPSGLYATLCVDGGGDERVVREGGETLATENKWLGNKGLFEGMMGWSIWVLLAYLHEA